MNGSCLTSFTATSRGSPALRTPRMREQMKLTSCNTGCSAGRRGMLIPISYLPVTTHFASMSLKLTTRLQFGNESLQRCPEIPLPLGCGWCTEDGRVHQTDWKGILPAPKAALACYLANAEGPVSFHHVPVRQLA